MVASASVFFFIMKFGLLENPFGFDPIIDGPFAWLYIADGGSSSSIFLS